MTELLQNICTIIRQCGEIYKDVRPMNDDCRTKTSYKDIVTKYDVKVQEFAVSALKKKYSDAAFVCEENDISCDMKDIELVFVIDPIDGTANFVSNFHHSCTSIAALRYDQPVAGAVYNPFSDELFYAEKGRGAFLNGRHISVSANNIENSLVLFGTSPYNPELMDITFDMVKKVNQKCIDVRRCGSAALDLCYIASGRAGLYFEATLSVWDYAAGVLIAQEAGGQCITFSDNPLSYKNEKQSIIAGTEDTITAFRNIVDFKI